MATKFRYQSVWISFNSTPPPGFPCKRRNNGKRKKLQVGDWSVTDSVKNRSQTEILLCKSK